MNRDRLSQKGKTYAIDRYCEIVGLTKDPCPDDALLIGEIESQLRERGSYHFEVLSSFCLSGRPERIDLDRDAFWELVEIEEENEE